MGNVAQAPILGFIGDKFDKDKQHYEIPQDIADIIFNELKDQSVKIRLMLVLIGTKEGWGVSEQWLLQRTGIVHSSYTRARRELIEKGWLVAGKTEGGINIIQVDFDAIRGKKEKIDVAPQDPKILTSHGDTPKQTSHDDTSKNRRSTVIPQNRGSMVIPQNEEELRREWGISDF